MFSQIAKYDWATWVMGIWRALILGGSSAVISGVTISIKDPKDWGVQTHSTEIALFELMGWLFATGAAAQFFLFLSTHPAPDPLQQTIAKAAASTHQAAEDQKAVAIEIVKQTPVALPAPPEPPSSAT